MLPGLSHSDHHELLQDYLNSDRIEDKAERTEVESQYYDKSKRSISGWMHRVKSAISSDFDNYRQDRLKEMAEEFLRQAGIEPRWK